jgi:hypothetical protein
MFSRFTSLSGHTVTVSYTKIQILLNGENVVDVLITEHCIITVMNIPSRSMNQTGVILINRAISYENDEV